VLTVGAGWLIETTVAGRNIRETSPRCQDRYNEEIKLPPATRDDEFEQDSPKDGVPKMKVMSLACHGRYRS
jgi:hypothetical protein